MSTNEAVATIIRNFKLALDAGGMYFVAHPLFVEKIEALEQSCALFFAHASALHIGVMPEALLIESHEYADSLQAMPLARLLHAKKIKSIHISQTTTTSDLANFLTIIARPSKELMAAGGISRVLTQKGVTGITVESLDYSALLKSEGGAGGDVWAHLLSEGIDKSDTVALNHCADHFEVSLGTFSLDTLVSNGQVCENVGQFFSLLKETEAKKYERCAKKVVQAALHEKKQFGHTEMTTLRSFVKDLREDAFTEALCDELVSKKQVDTFNLNVFSQFADAETHKKIADSIDTKIRNKEIDLADPSVRKKVKELFSGDSSHHLPDVYRHLASQLRSAYTEGTQFKLNHEHARENFKEVLFGLLQSETSVQRYAELLRRIAGLWGKIHDPFDSAYCIKIFTLVAARRKEDMWQVTEADMFLAEIGAEVESRVFAGTLSENEGKMWVTVLKKSRHTADEYAACLFRAENLRPTAMRFFCAFFPSELRSIYPYFEEKKGDPRFLNHCIDLFATIDTKESVAALKAIFMVSGTIGRQKVLRAMAKLATCDEDFLLQICRDGQNLLLREVLLYARENNVLAQKLVARLPVPMWLVGMRRKRVAETLHMIMELEIVTMEPYVAQCKKVFGFWNGAIRRQARALLKQWGDGI